MVSSREFGAYIKVNVNSETPTVPTVPGHSRLSLTVPDCPKCVPRSCVTFISKNNRCGTLLKARTLPARPPTTQLSQGISRTHVSAFWHFPTGHRSRPRCFLEIPCRSQMVEGLAGSAPRLQKCPASIIIAYKCHT